MFGRKRPRILKARLDPDYPEAPCLLVWGGVSDMSEGETIDVRMPDRVIIPGFVRDWIPSQEDGPGVGTWVIQIAPLAEADDQVCTCFTVQDEDGRLVIENPYCVYHMMEEED